MATANEAWINLLEHVMECGMECAPRGLKIKEVLCYVSRVNMRYPVLTVPDRNIGHKFMSAEAAWILSGDNRVATIAPYSREIAKFSDDAYLFFGAYGPRVLDQLPHIVRTLGEDNDSRQAVMTIWRSNPPKTKDVPCTVAVQWFIRENTLHCVDTMRSSDAWLGWPYDIFNFTMLSGYVALYLRSVYKLELQLGSLTLCAASQHVYEPQWEAVRALLKKVHGAGKAEGEFKPLEYESPQDLVDDLWHCARETVLGATEILS